MFISKDVARQYKKAVNEVERSIGPSSAVTAFADLVGSRVNSTTLYDTHQSYMPEFEGLVFPERKRHPLKLMATLAIQSELRLILPVCPPAPLHPSTFRPYATLEAKAGIRAANVLAGPLADKIGLVVRPLVLLADTERDLEPVMERGGGIERYQEICDESLQIIRDEVREGIVADSFSNHFGENGGSLGYYRLQYAAETAIRSQMDNDTNFAEKMRRISEKRADKHGEILGRPEQNYELAVRYAGQYTALGDYIRESEFGGVCNYPTPNNDFYNRPGAEIVPVFESRLDRRTP